MSIDKSAPGGDYYKGGETTPGGGTTFDSDGDGVADQVGYDTDGDGLLDTYNIDTNGDQWTDTTVTDFDHDGYADAGSATVYQNQYDTGQNSGGGGVAGDGSPAAPTTSEPSAAPASWTQETFEDTANGSYTASDPAVASDFESEVFSTSDTGESSGGATTTSGYYDSDGDGYADAQDTYDSSGNYVGTSWDTNQDYVQDVYGVDTNGDGTLDTYGIDIDNNGSIDYTVTDSNGDGVADGFSYDGG